MNYELAKRLKDAGFPPVTIWEVENNYVRGISACGESVPPLGALCAEMKVPFGLEKVGHKMYLAYTMVYNQNLTKTTGEEWEVRRPDAVDFNSYRDDTIEHCFYGNTPEIALAKLLIALNKK